MKKIILILCSCFCLFSNLQAQINAPEIQLNINDVQIDMNWPPVNGASGYRLYYAPYPFTGIETIGSFDLGDVNRLTFSLWPGAAFYITLNGYNASEEGAYSEIELIRIENNLSALPSGLSLTDIPGGTFTMGNNNLTGPQAGQAAEHQVTLSAFQMSTTEISNLQYIEFLNQAFSAGLIEISSGSIGPDNGLRLVTGTTQSGYAGKVLYNLDGTRVMKDHDNADGDHNEFTGDIEPENPLNIAYIGFDNNSRTFYLKDPHNPQDFDWQQLCNYYHYSSIAHQTDESTLFNDFSSWPELNGWSAQNPQAALSLPTLSEVGDYPVTFIRWWGAYAFADFYQLSLPSEAQWEYAAKGGNNFQYAVFDGVTTSDANWNSENAHPALHHVRAVSSGRANPFGLYNMGGNVWEWMADHYAPYNSDSVDNPLIEVAGSTTRSWRGGSWNYHEATLETSGRYFDDENRGNDHFGFRVVNNP